MYFYQLTSNNVMFLQNKSFSIQAPSPTSDPQCASTPSQHLLFQFANLIFLISYLLPNGKYCLLLLHSLLIFGFMSFTFWAWSVICASSVFIWNFCYTIINIGQTIYLLYHMRHFKFPDELEEIYQTIFEPMQISRITFQKLVSSENAQTMTLIPGESYAVENVTRTDRLGLLLSGRVNVISNNNYLHSIEPKQFLDSPEYESNKSGKEEKFRVSIIGAMDSKYIVWQRTTLEYFLLKEAFLSNMLSLILARDVCDKLYKMNEKVVTDKGGHVDIRLPSTCESLCNSASSLTDDSQEPKRSNSPSKPRLTLRVKDRNVPNMKGARSKSLQTNSLGVPVFSPRLGIRAKIRRQTADPSQFSDLSEFSEEFLNIPSTNFPQHGVRFKVDIPKD